MSAIVWSDVIAEAGELNGKMSDAAQVGILAYVNNNLNAAGYDGENGPQTKLARIYLAAHMATLSLRRGFAGSAQSMSAGPLSISYAQFANLRSPFDTTSYGVLLRGLTAGSAHRAGLLV